MDHVLTLYVSGQSRLSQDAIGRIETICEDRLCGKYQLDVVDVFEHPDMAEKDKILATPTLVRRLPPPLRRIVGSMSNEREVLLGLDLVERAEPVQEPEF
ncbi:MAG: circadian clock KaiB family protein [Pseudomonadota bacterium]